MKETKKVWFEELFLQNPCPDIIPRLIDWELKHGANINEQNESGETVLYYAILRCDFDVVLDVVELLLKSGVNPNICGKNNESPLMVAISSKREELSWKQQKIVLVNLLLEHQADPNLQDKDGYTALMCAIQERDIEIVETLFEYGVNANLKNSNGMSALDMTKNLTFRASIHDHNGYYKALENYEKAIEINKQLETMLTEYMAGNYKKREDLENLKTDEKKEEVSDSDYESGLPW